MTASSEALRRDLAEALTGGYASVRDEELPMPTHEWTVRLADTLLPVVERAIAAGQAQAWADAADELLLSGMPVTHWAVTGFRARAGLSAASLTETEDER